VVKIKLFYYFFKNLCRLVL